MNPDDRDAGHLLDMLHHARGVVSAIKGVTFDDYTDDEDLRMIVERRVQIIGEAAKRVSRDFQEAHPEIPWRKIAGQRNVLVHEYGEIQDDLMWKLVTVSIPELIRQLEPIVPSSPT
jgi:uncharacterized protein with HEPN domain